MGSPLELTEDWLERIKQSVEGLEYGHVQIIIHDGRIVQIERLERRRFNQEPFSQAAKAPATASASVPKPSIDKQRVKKV